MSARALRNLDDALMAGEGEPAASSFGVCPTCGDGDAPDCEECQGAGVAEVPIDPRQATDFDDADDLYGGGCGGVEDREDPNDY